MTKKPNCYECKHRGSVAGSAHSKCVHPENSDLLNDPLLSLLAIMGMGEPVTSNLSVTANEHGINNGWFSWPFDFDPCWLITCDGFEYTK